MQLLASQHDVAGLRRVAMNTLAVSPSDLTAQSWLARAATLPAGPVPTASPQSPEDWLTQSLALYQQGKYVDSIHAALKAIKLRPGLRARMEQRSRPATTNSANAGREGIAAAREAVRLDPNFQLAKNNLAWSMSQKQKSR